MGDLLFCIFVDGVKQTAAHFIDACIGHLSARGGRIAAAAELFHDELHVDLAERARGQVHARAVLIEHDRGMDAAALECKYLANEKDGSFSIISFGLPILDFTAQSRFSFGPYIEIFQMDGLLTVK